MPLPKLKTWAVDKGLLESAWLDYTRRLSFPKSGDGEEFLIWSAFQYAFAKGWMSYNNLHPDYNVVEFV